MSLSDHISQETRRVERFPSDPQKRAGNYRKGHVKIHGLDISIENPRGSFREGKDSDGNRWRTRLPAHYEYFKGTEGADGDHVDAYVGPHPRSPLVYVVDQLNHRTGRFDEHKAFVGFSSPKQVKNTYLAAFSDGKGHERLGHLEEMTVAQFKDWLKNGDTRRAMKRRAGGGRIGMADGGTPMSDADVFGSSGADAAGSLMSDADVFGTGADTSDAGQTPDMGALAAAAHGTASGATFGFSDELRGLYGAGKTVPEWIPGARLMEGAGRLASNYLFNNDPDALKRYDAARDAERQAQETAKATHALAYGAGEFAGSIPAMAVLPETGLVRGAGLLADIGRGAIMGTEYGALSGAGEGTDLVSRAENATAGAVGGAGAGVVAPVLGKAVEAAGQHFVQPVVQAVKGWADPEAEASRRLGAALQRDNEMILAGTAKGMTPQQWIAARNAGEPVTLADLGAGNTQALLRSAANTSPEGRAMLDQVIGDRFLNQQQRVADTIRGLVPGGANAGKTAEDLLADYDRGRKPLYQRAYQQGDREIMTPTMERLMGSPTFVDAMRRATLSGKDRAITEGYGAFNPGVTVENGLVKFKPKPNGVPTYPNLQFWDATKRELDDMASAAARSGEKGRAGVIGNMANTLRGELDDEVPSYAAARGFASQYFGASNALEAGRQMAGRKIPPDVIQRAMAKMQPDERELFREGYASDWADRVTGNMSQTRDITKAMFNSPNERARAEAVFGPAGMAKIQARMTLETIMDGARRAMGNSTTARQLIEAGLAGGAIEGYLSNWDPTHMAVGALTGAGARKALGAEMASGARQLIGRVDARTARKVAELLTSDDPRQLHQGLRLAAGNQRIMNGLKRVANVLSLSGLAPSGREAAISIHPGLQGPVPVTADQKQPQPYGIGH